MPQKGIQWLQMYKWLHFDGESQLMSCDSHSDWCTKFGKDDPDGKFVNGTDNFKKTPQITGGGGGGIRVFRDGVRL